MKVTTNSTETITWDIDGCSAQAGVLTEAGRGVYINGVVILMKGDSDNNRFESNDEQFIRDVHKALGELIAHTDRKRGLGRDKGIDEKQPLYMAPEARLDLADTFYQPSKTVKGNMSTTTEGKEEC